MHTDKGHKATTKLTIARSRKSFPNVFTKNKAVKRGFMNRGVKRLCHKVKPKSNRSVRPSDGGGVWLCFAISRKWVWSHGQTADAALPGSCRRADKASSAGEIIPASRSSQCAICKNNKNPRQETSFCQNKTRWSELHMMREQLNLVCVCVRNSL